MRSLLAPALLLASIACPTLAVAADAPPSVAPAAGPTTGLQWNWEGQSRRYQIKGDIKLGEWMFFNAEENVDVRVAEFLVGVTTTCAPVMKAGKSGWELACTLEDVMFIGAPPPRDAGRLLPILDEMDGKLTGATVQLVVSNDGKVKSVDLEGIEDKGYSRRLNLIHENMRLVLARLFAALDSELPKAGDDKGRGWVQKGSPTMGFASVYGTWGLGEITNQVTRIDGTVVEIGQSGKGILGPGEMITVAPGQPERPKNLYDMVLQGVARFDTADGSLVEREYLVEGVPTASSLTSEGAQGVTYVQAVRLVRIPDGQAAPALGPNEETAPQRALP